ncbi:uncharacterized protein LOC135837987 [Planococcus citri]|uniref:uncharacterized protein LOC135837987 n=1 Tax=Planococcus citri TaxID=170843 RepID=UPI0031F92616
MTDKSTPRRSWSPTPEHLKEAADLIEIAEYEDAIEKRCQRKKMSNPAPDASVITGDALKIFNLENRLREMETANDMLFANLEACVREKHRYRKKYEYAKDELSKSETMKLSYEKVLRIIGVRFKLENFVDKNYPLRENKKTGEIVYGKPDSSYCDALNEMLVSKDDRFTKDAFIVMIRQRLIDNKVNSAVFMKFARWLYSQFSDEACHRMAQFCPPLPKFNDDKGISEMLESVEIDEDVPSVICIKIILQPLDLPAISP